MSDPQNDDLVDLFSVSGDLQLGKSETRLQTRGVVDSPDFRVDEHRRAFVRSTLYIDTEQDHQVVVLSARQVELLLKLLGVVPYAPKEEDTQHSSA